MRFKRGAAAQSAEKPQDAVARVRTGLALALVSAQKEVLTYGCRSVAVAHTSVRKAADTPFRRIVYLSPLDCDRETDRPLKKTCTLARH